MIPENQVKQRHNMKKTKKILEAKRKKASASKSIHREPIPEFILEFVGRFRVIKGKPYTLRGREFLGGIYLCPVKQINVVKGRQMGMTEVAINWLLYHLLRNENTVGLYITDRQEHVDAFADRMRQAIESSELLKPWVTKITRTHVKFANNSTLYMITGWNKFENARSYPADFVVIDEAQSLDLEALPVVKETMASSPHGRLMIIGTGSDEGDEWHKEWSRGTPWIWRKAEAKKKEKVDVSRSQLGYDSGIG
jgi:hypothetical protein